MSRERNPTVVRKTASAPERTNQITAQIHWLWQNNIISERYYYGSCVDTKTAEIRHENGQKRTEVIHTHTIKKKHCSWKDEENWWLSRKSQLKNGGFCQTWAFVKCNKTFKKKSPLSQRRHRWTTDWALTLMAQSGGALIADLYLEDFQGDDRCPGWICIFVSF